MKLLLDTHSFLWFTAGSERLSIAARTLIESPTNQSYLSMASLWEMAIKLSIGKLQLVQPFETFITDQIDLNGIEILQIKTDHIIAVASLPFYHRDPFDRLIIAQAQVDGFSIVGADVAFDAYEIQRLW
ncbi:MAG: type II toxin-antitoxin system VapC family toxin [Anaerolineae bacterium]|nr:type II toxin-antitoxin system VapC family toxin [Anaerolineae bacterium]